MKKFSRVPAFFLVLPSAAVAATPTDPAALRTQRMDDVSNGHEAAGERATHAERTVIAARIHGWHSLKTEEGARRPGLTFLP